MTEDGWETGGADVRIRRIDPPRVQILRLRRPSTATLASLDACLGLALPRVANRAAGHAPRALSLAPDEWMLVGSTRNDEAVMAAAADAAVAHVANVSHGRIVYQVEGRMAPALVSKGCTLDLHPRTFGGRDHCALSVLAQVPILIDQVADDPVFHVYADASYAHHLELWFEDAAIEFRREDAA